MRSTDERVADVKRRIKELTKQKKQKYHRLIALSAVVCLIIIVGMGVSMPSIMERLAQGDYTNTGIMAASIFYEGGAPGYVLVGLLAFTLGVCFTVLSYRMSRRNKQGDGDDE